MSVSSTPIVNEPSLYVNGLQVSWATNTTLTIAAGIARDSTNSIDMNLGNYLQTTQANTTLNAAINGANGLDTGSLANSTFYYVFAIGSSMNLAPTATLLSTSATAPILPSNYDSFRRIGAVLTDGSAHFLKQFTLGNGGYRTTWYDVVITELSAAGNTSYTAVDLTSSVPSTSQMVYLDWKLAPNSAGNSALLRPTGSTSTTNQQLFASVASQPNAGQMLMNLSAAQSLDYKTTSASDALTLLTAGYIDSL